jgi:LmbE family N-acetylglucosaminyl deacetylase
MSGLSNSLSELRREAMEHRVVAQISGTTLWRWLSQDALRPRPHAVLAHVVERHRLDRIAEARTDHRGCYRAAAIALRESLIALAVARVAGEGQQTKMELVYQYLTGPRFRHRIEAVVERFSDMQADLDRERKTMMRLWAKREEQIRGVVESTAGLYGDLQGIAGRSLVEIDGLKLPLLDAPAADAAE